MTFFAWDGPLLGFLGRLGNIILVTLLWLLCCLPVVTIVPATTSFYYAMVKSVRRERGYPAREFFASMKRTLLPGVAESAALLLWTGICLYGRRYQILQGNLRMERIYEALLLLTALLLPVFLAVNSRFSWRLPELLKASVFLGIRYLHLSLLLLAGAALTAWLLADVLPIVCILILPGVWCYAATYPAEIMLRKITPAPPEGTDAWYLEEDPKREKRSRHEKRG